MCKEWLLSNSDYVPYSGKIVNNEISKIIHSVTDSHTMTVSSLNLKEYTIIVILTNQSLMYDPLLTKI